MQQLGNCMSAQEFGQHYALECEEPLPSAHRGAVCALLAALANGPLSAPKTGGPWRAQDFMPGIWDAALDEDVPQVDEAPLTVDQILARARAGGMVH